MGRCRRENFKSSNPFRRSWTDNQTLVRVTEGKMEANDKGISWLAQNTEGWANFLACLKAYMEHGINLRKGGFDFMKK